MASVSFEIARNGGAIDDLSAGAQSVTEGTAAPTTANALQVRIDMATPWTKKDIGIALDTIERYLLDVTKSTSIPL